MALSLLLRPCSADFHKLSVVCLRSEHGLEELIGAVRHQPLSKTIKQAAHGANEATTATATTAVAVSSAVAGQLRTTAHMFVVATWATTL